MGGKRPVIWLRLAKVGGREKMGDFESKLGREVIRKALRVVFEQKIQQF
jgi:hypothetical protein